MDKKVNKSIILIIAMAAFFRISQNLELVHKYLPDLIHSFINTTALIHSFSMHSHVDITRTSHPIGFSIDPSTTSLLLATLIKLRCSNVQHREVH